MRILLRLDADPMLDRIRVDQVICLRMTLFEGMLMLADQGRDKPAQ